MKIAQLVASLDARHGGPTRSVRWLSESLAAREQVTLLSLQTGETAFETDGAVRVEKFARTWPSRLGGSRALRSRLLQTRWDVVHHHGLWLRTLHYAHEAARASGAPLVLSPRGMASPWAWAHHRLRKKFAQAWIHPGAFAAVAGWHATSAEEADDLRALGFAQPICVAPNGVHRPTNASEAAAAVTWRELCPEASGRPVALFHSRFHRKKRVLELIDIWLRVAPPEWLLLLVGIPEEYEPATLSAEVAQRGGAARVRVFSGLDRPSPYAIASLFLLPSHHENFGLVVAEAMAAGVPALVTDTTPWSALNDDARGWCVPWEQYTSTLAVALAEGAPALRARGARAREWVLREYSWDRCARTLADFYTSLRGGGAR